MMAATSWVCTKVARIAAQATALALVVSVAYASAKCAAEVAAEAAHGHSQAVASQYPDDGGGHSAPDQSHPHNDDPLDCCSTFTALHAGIQPAIVHPELNSSAHLLVVALFSDLSVLVPHADFMYDHGPPGQAPPEFLSVRSLSPRAPPLSV